MKNNHNEANSNNVIVINPIGSCEKLYNIQEKVIDLMKSAKTSFKDDVTLNKMLVNLSDKIDEQHQRYENVIKIISQYWGKYVHMEWAYNANYGEDREVKPEWNIDLECNALLYRFNSENNCLFGIFCKINDQFRGGLKDDSIDLAYLIKDHRLQIREITEEEFLEQAQKTSFNCLKSRLDKIESGIYKLTENGYIYPSSYSFQIGEA